MAYTSAYAMLFSLALVTHEGVKGLGNKATPAHCRRTKEDGVKWGKQGLSLARRLGR